MSTTELQAQRPSGASLEALLKIEDVASFLNLSPRTVRRLVATRQLRCIRVGRALRFDSADVFRFVAGRRE